MVDLSFKSNFLVAPFFCHSTFHRVFRQWSDTVPCVVIFRPFSAFKFVLVLYIFSQNQLFKIFNFNEPFNLRCMVSSSSKLPLWMHLLKPIFFIPGLKPGAIKYRPCRANMRKFTYIKLRASDSQLPSFLSSNIIRIKLKSQSFTGCHFRMADFFSHLVNGSHFYLIVCWNKQIEFDTKLNCSFDNLP